MARYTNIPKTTAPDGERIYKRTWEQEKKNEWNIK